MTVSLPGGSGKGFAGLFKRKNNDDKVSTIAQRKLSSSDVAKLFDKKVRIASATKPAALRASELNEGEQLSSLRGALYSRDK